VAKAPVGCGQTGRGQRALQQDFGEFIAVSPA